uniref:C2H2-type domain-containing protein n=1 Tax=Anopheles melas TaxID=34690 RepID=A0A182U523_9DIPT
MKMRALAMKCRERLLEMRAAQRNAQKDEDEKSEDGAGGDEGKRPGFCLLCRLNYRQPRAVHQQSEGHKMMKKFLMPYCSVCKLGFKSPMAFETHRASLDHLKIKARVERYASSTKGDDSGDENQAEAGDLDLDSMTIVDEVGKVDDICEPGVAGETPTRKQRSYGDGGGGGSGRAGTEDEDDEDDDDDEEEDDENQMIIGEEHVKKVQVQYCDLCNMYLPRRTENQDRVLREHCKKRSHLKLYIRFRNDKKLREQAERFHKKKLKGDKEAAGKKGDDKKANDSITSTDSKTVTDGNSTANTNDTTSTPKSEGETRSDKKSDTATTGSATESANNATSAKVNTSSASKTDVDSSDANRSLDGSNSTTTTLAATIGGADGPGEPSDELVDKLMWQVVDNEDLGDLLRDVQDDAEEEDDDKTNLERYDKFRHTEKNGGEQRSDAAGADENTVASKAQAKKGTSANGGGGADVAANGEASKEAKPAA